MSLFLGERKDVFFFWSCLCNVLSFLLPPTIIHAKHNSKSFLEYEVLRLKSIRLVALYFGMVILTRGPEILRTIKP